MNTLEELEAIRARHEVEEDGWGGSFWPAVAGVAHQDRATLLRLLDAARAELAEVANAAEVFRMWNDFDDGRPDDKTVESLIPARAYRRLAAALKAPLTRAQGESS
jgi:hypothetical protein